MPHDYLVHVLVLGLMSAAALAPPRRPAPLAMAGFLIGMVVNEVPHWALGLLTALTGLAIWRGELGTDALSCVLLAGAGATAAMQMVLIRRGIRAPAAAEAALHDAGIPPPRETRPRWRVALTPLPFKPRALRRRRNLSYGDHRRQRLDVFCRRDGDLAGPVVVYLHGGGYSSGSKNWEGRGLLHHLAARGWLCISATYRLRPGAHFDDHLDDARAALAWARAHAADYGADASTVVMAGSSAGAHLTSLHALGGPADERPAAAICLYGYYGRYYGRDVDEPTTSTPLALAATHAPPMLIAHGSLDSNTSAAAARELAEKVRAESSSPLVHVELPGGQHAFDLVNSWRTSAVIDAVDALLHHVAITTPTHTERTPR